MNNMEIKTIIKKLEVAYLKFATEGYTRHAAGIRREIEEWEKKLNSYENSYEKEIKKILDSVDFNQHNNEWEYDGVWLTRKEVTTRVLEDITNVLNMQKLEGGG